MIVLEFYGFLGDQHGNESYFTKTTPFFKNDDGTTLLYSNTDMEVVEVKDSDKRFIYPVEQFAEGTLGLTLALTGDEFADTLDKLQVPHDIRGWNKSGTFRWKLMTDIAFQEHEESYKGFAQAWLQKTLASSEPLDDVSVNGAVTLLTTTGSVTAEDFILPGIAFKRMQDDYSYGFTRTMAAYNSEFFSSSEEFDSAVSRHELTR